MKNKIEQELNNIDFVVMEKFWKLNNFVFDASSFIHSLNDESISQWLLYILFYAGHRVHYVNQKSLLEN